MSAHSSFTTQLLAEAAEWRSKLMNRRSETSPEFEAWLARSTAHRQVWEHVQAPWTLLGEQAASPELLALRQAALADARAVSGARSARYRMLRSSLTRWMAATAAAGLIASGYFAWSWLHPAVYRTASGERRTVTLSDGSQMTLDSLTEVRVTFGRHSRDLTLTRGQARFDVVHDVERPFAVLAAGRKVVATGTSFMVDLVGTDLRVTLIEGHVVVLPEGQDQTLPMASEPSPAKIPGALGRSMSDAVARTSAVSVELKAGEQLLATSTTSGVHTVNLQKATAWENGQLVFDDEPLSEIIPRINRYSVRKVEMPGSRVAGLHVSGVFHTGDAAGFVSTITSYLPLRAEYATDGSIRLVHR